MAKKSTNDNLKPIRSVDEAREKGKKGGIASGEARAARKALREELLDLLTDDNTQMKISLALIKKASKGDVKAFIAIRDTIGEKPVEKVVTAEVDPSVIDAIEKMVNDDSKPSS